MEPLQELGGRKFLLAVLIVCITAALTAFQCIDRGGYTTIILAVLASYFTANVVVKKNAADAAAPKVPDVQMVEITK